VLRYGNSKVSNFDMRGNPEDHQARSGSGDGLPNILLVVMDTTRADRLSCYGHDRSTSPALDRFAEKSTRYTRAYASSSWTIPSHGSLFTGLPPSLHGMYLGRHTPVEGVSLFTDSLRSKGYRCHSLSSNFLLSSLMESLQGQDYPVYEEGPYLPSDRFALRCVKSEQSVLQEMNPARPGGRLRNIRSWLSRIRRQLAPGILRLTGLPRGLYVTDDATHATRACVQKGGEILKESDSPVFLFMNLMQAHWAYNPPPETRGRFGLRRRWWTLPDHEICHTVEHGMQTPGREGGLEQLQAAYDEELLFQDRMLGKLLDALERSGELDRTLVILTSDHGEALGEHRQLGHGCSLYNEATRVPLIIHYPKSAGIRPGPEDRLVSLEDIYATVLAGATCTEGDPTHGYSRSLLDGPSRNHVLLQQAYEDSRLLLHRCELCGRGDSRRFWDNQSMLGLVDPQNRKILKMFSGRIELYDLAKDPQERENLVDQAPWKDELLRMLDEVTIQSSYSPRFREMKGPIESPESAGAEEVEERLRALGYI
jgi:arylsulfatase A-like enzyme